MAKMICIKNASVLTMSDLLGDMECADILIDGSRIVAVGSDLDAGDAEVVDARGMIAMPGFIDAHRHLWQTNLKHLACDWTLTEYLLSTRALLSGAYEPEDLFLGQYAGGIEALNAGVTTVVDHAHNLASPEHVDAAIDGTRKANIRSVFCYGMGDVAQDGKLFESFATPAWHFDDFKRVSVEKFGDDYPLMTLGMALNELPFSAIENQQKEILLARERGAGLITFHMSIPGREHIVEMAEAGVLGPDMLVTHGFFMSDNELRLLADNGVSVVSTLDSELQMGMGHGITTRAREFGINHSLGVDIVSGNSGDLFTQMRLSLQTQRAFSNQKLLDEGGKVDKVSATVRDVLEAATIGGARAAGLADQIGSIEVGKQADIILINTNRLGLQPMGDLAASVVMYASEGDVDTVMVGGTLVKSSGRLLNVDEADLIDQLTKSRHSVLNKTRNISSDVINKLCEMGLPTVFKH